MAPILVLVLAAGAVAPSLPLEMEQKRSRREPYALLFGTVFEESGRLVRGARVEVWTSGAAKGGKKWQAQSDMQGEFSVHLPAGKNVYIVEAQAPGMEPARKEVAFETDERVDVVLHLSPKKR